MANPRPMPLRPDAPWQIVKACDLAFTVLLVSEAVRNPWSPL
jgi:hypothetical protein